MSSVTKQVQDHQEESIVDDRYVLDPNAPEGRREVHVWESSRLDTNQFLSALRSEQKTLARTSEHYRQIGLALSIAETVSWKIGTIKLFPTRRIQALKEIYKGPMDTFLRESLSTVPTSTLEFYVEDLDNMTAEASSLEALSVTPLSFLERSGVLLLLTPLIFILSALFFRSKMPVHFGTEALLALAAALPTILYVGIVYVLISETYRRASFSIALGWEILRRKGGDTPGASGLQICPT